MFKLYEYLTFNPGNLTHCCIYNIVNINQYLHSDGQVFDTLEYWSTKENTQAVMDKFYPKPKHVWKHGDVFMSGDLSMIYIKYDNGKPAQAICLESPVSGPAFGNMSHRLNEAKFLFNIKEKI